jgi:transaldolase
MTSYKSPLHEMTQITPTCLRNDSAALDELRYPIEHGAVGGDAYLERSATEDQIAWALVEEISATRAKLLKHIFDEHRGAGTAGFPFRPTPVCTGIPGFS